MSEILNPAPASAEDRSHFKAYMVVFAALCVFTALSFAANELVQNDKITKHTGLAIIMGVAVVKALCVALIFMHLLADWGKVFFIVIPVSIMGVMMLLVFMPDILLAWHHTPIPALDSQPMPLVEMLPKGTH